MLGQKQHKASGIKGDMLAAHSCLKTSAYVQEKPSSHLYPFGSSMVSCSNAEYHYSFGMNTQEKDDEIYGEGNSYSAEYWQYDSRLGRRWNNDPRPNPSISVHACFGNNPIWFSDVAGDSIQVRYKENTGFRKIFEKTKIYTYKNDGTDKDFETNSKYLKNSIAAIDKILENDDAYISRIIKDDKENIMIRHFGGTNQLYRPGVYIVSQKTIRWEFNKAEVFVDLDFIMAPFEILNHELGHAYINLYYSEEEKERLKIEFALLPKEEQAKWNFSWEEKEVIENMERKLSTKVHLGKQRDTYLENSQTVKVNNSTSTTK